MNYLYINSNCEKKIRITRPEKYMIMLENVSGKLEVQIESEHAEVDILGIYDGRNTNAYELSTVQRHIAPGSRSNLWIKGVFDDYSRFIYNGLIQIEQGAHQSHAFQKNQNLILSDEVSVVSKPDLEILADDVYCTHASTSGSLRESDLFYYYTRGLNTADATKSILSGFLNEIFLYMSDIGLTDKLNSLITYKQYYA